jgi:hypothetical protein
MIRDLESFENISITVRLKNGDLYEKRDTTSQPFGKEEKVVCIWTSENTLTIFPMDVVDRIQIHLPEMDKENNSEF